MNFVLDIVLDICVIAFHAYIGFMGAKFKTLFS